MRPDFQRYALALFRDGRVLFESNESMLKPLVEMVQIYRGQQENCELHDKIVGLASAKIIVASGIVSELHAGVMSEPARDFLRGYDINFTYQELTGDIMNRERSGQCPMETKAMEIDDPEEFFQAMVGLMGV